MPCAAAPQPIPSAVRARKLCPGYRSRMALRRFSREKSLHLKRQAMRGLFANLRRQRGAESVVVGCSLIYQSTHIAQGTRYATGLSDKTYLQTMTTTSSAATERMSRVPRGGAHKNAWICGFGGGLLRWKKRRWRITETLSWATPHANTRPQCTHSALTPLAAGHKTQFRVYLRSWLGGLSVALLAASVCVCACVRVGVFGERGLREDGSLSQDPLGIRNILLNVVGTVFVVYKRKFGRHWTGGRTAERQLCMRPHVSVRSFCLSRLPRF